MYDLIIKNGQIVDGTGKKTFPGDVAVLEDKIAEVGILKKANAREIIDASGKFVTPGFIDIQNHSDVYWTLFDNPRQDSLLAQGITTALLGACGASLAPLLSRDALFSVRKWHDLQGVNFNWLSFAEYLKELSSRPLGINIASLVGYSTLRRGLLHDEVRALKEGEQKIIFKALEESLQAGAFGLSSGLSYAHEAILSESELVALAGVVRRYNGLMSVHLRSEGSEITESVDEALDLVYKLSVNLKISHLKARNKSNWHLLPHALSQIEEVYQKIGGVHFDVYPYDFVWQVLYTYLPRWAYEGGRSSMLHHLKDETQRKKILAYLNSRDTDYSQIFIAGTTMPINIIGKTIGEIAKRHNISSEEALLTVIENGGSEVLVFDQNLNETQVELLLGHPLSIVATDGAGFAASGNSGLVHPRCFGAMPKYLSWAFQKNILIEDAVKKITSTPADKIGLKNRGRIAAGNFADLVILDAGLKTAASARNPFQFPEGIEYVLVNGAAAVQKSNLTEKLNGRVLKRV